MDWVQSQACKIFKKKSDSNHFIVKCTSAWKSKSQKLWKIHDQNFASTVYAGGNCFETNNKS